MTRTMKNSGVEWIGQIPASWKSGRIKDILNILTDYTANGSFADLAKNVEYLDYESYARLVRLTDLRSFLQNYDAVYVDKNSYDYLSKSKLFGGEILVANVGAYAGLFCEMPKLNINATLGPNMFLITTNQKMLQHFLFYLGNSDIIYKQLSAKMASAAQPKLNKQDIKTTYLLIPPLPEQQAIADYLDDKCAQIDNITATINEQIEVLKQYKKSVITEAVTKGLDPNVPMKGSGVEWIGQISEKWNIERFKYNFTFSKGLQITKADLREEGCPVISYGQIHSKINNGVSVNLKLIRFVDGSYQEEKSAITQYGDIIWADTSEDYDGIGNSIFIDSNKNIFAGYHTIITRPLLDKITKYFAYLFQTDIWRLQLRKQATGIKVFSITQKMLKNCSILIPPLCEQQAIADYLDDKCAQIDAVIADKQTQLETLAAYKKSLIYEYVTGKKSVPGFEEA